MHAWISQGQKMASCSRDISTESYYMAAGWAGKPPQGMYSLINLLLGNNTFILYLLIFPEETFHCKIILPIDSLPKIMNFNLCQTTCYYINK